MNIKNYKSHQQNFTALYIINGQRRDLNNIKYYCQTQQNSGLNTSIEVRPSHEFNTKNIQLLYGTENDFNHISALKQYVSEHNNEFSPANFFSYDDYVKENNMFKKLKQGKSDEFLDYLINNVWNKLDKIKNKYLDKLEGLCHIDCKNIKILQADEVLKAIENNSFDFANGIIKTRK